MLHKRKPKLPSSLQLDDAELNSNNGGFEFKIQKEQQTITKFQAPNIQIEEDKQEK